MERSHSIFMEKSFNVWLWMAGAFAALCLIGSAVRAESLGTVQVIGSAEAENVKKIALTFDDGPHPVYTPLLLDGLAKRKVKATFFITGENAENQRHFLLHIASPYLDGSMFLANRILTFVIKHLKSIQ